MTISENGSTKMSLSPVEQSFIGSHLVDKLVSLGAKVTVVDDLSSGNLENLSAVKNKVKFIKKDLEYIKKDEMREIFSDQNIVFHLPLFMVVGVIFRLIRLMYVATCL